MKSEKMKLKNMGLDKIKNIITKHIRPIIIAFVIIVAFTGVTISATELNSDAPKLDISQGVVYAKDVSINTKIPGRIAKIFVEEGQEVKVGDPIVEISSDELQAKKMQLLAQIDQAKAGVEASQAVVEMAEGNYELALDRVEQAKAGVSASSSQKDMAQAMNQKAQNGARNQQVAQAESGFLFMDATYNRALILYESGAISKQKLEEIKTQRDVYEQTLDMAKEGARSEDIMAASAQVALAQAGVTSSNAVLNQAYEAANIALAQITQAQAGLLASQGKLDQANGGLLEVEVYINDAIIKSPIDGTITTLNSDEGELVSTGTSIGTISNLDTCWVSVNLDENKLAGVVEDQMVDVNLLAYPGQVFKGKVVTISKQPDFAVKKATSENGNFDIVSFGVKIQLENVEQQIRPGMTAMIDFNKMDVR